jgi:hypothetical protein
LSVVVIVFQPFIRAFIVSHKQQTNDPSKCDVCSWFAEQAASSGGGGGNGSGETHENILSQRPPHMTPSLLPVDNLPTQRHGKDDVDDIGLPTPAELQETDEQSKKA